MFLKHISLFSYGFFACGLNAVINSACKNISLCNRRLHKKFNLVLEKTAILNKAEKIFIYLISFVASKFLYISWLFFFIVFKINTRIYIQDRIYTVSYMFISFFLRYYQSIFQFYDTDIKIFNLNFKKF